MVGKSRVDQRGSEVLFVYIQNGQLEGGRSHVDQLGSKEDTTRPETPHCLLELEKPG